MFMQSWRRRLFLTHAYKPDNFEENRARNKNSLPGQSKYECDIDLWWCLLPFSPGLAIYYKWVDPFIQSTLARQISWKRGNTTLVGNRQEVLFEKAKKKPFPVPKSHQTNKMKCWHERTKRAHDQRLMSFSSSQPTVVFETPKVVGSSATIFLWRPFSPRAPQ